MSTDRQVLVDQLIVHEGLRLMPYVDTVGKVTIGVGRNLTDNGISHAEAMLLLDHDLDEAMTDLSTFPWFAALDPVRQRVLVDMRFNLGPSRFRSFKRMLRMVSEQNYQQAAASMRASLWAQQVKSRATRLIAMMQAGVDV